MAYYYVPLEQIKRGKDLNKKETYFGYVPWVGSTDNRIKYNESGNDLFLIVEYNSADRETAVEILTGKEIPILWATREGPQLKNFHCKQKNPHTYIRNITIDHANGFCDEDTFNEKNNLQCMEYRQAKHILELYKQRFTKESLSLLLDNLFLEGENIIKENMALKKRQEEQEKQEEQEIAQMIYALKNHS